MFVHLGCFSFILLFIIVFVHGETCYRFQLEGLKDNEDYNKFITASVTSDIKTNNETGESRIVLGGYIETNIDIDDRVQIGLSVMKETENGKQKTFSYSNELCKLILEDPFKKIVEALGIKDGCPIPKKNYQLAETPEVSMQPLKDLMTEDNKGPYEIVVIFNSSDDPTNPISSHTAIGSIEDIEC